MPRARDRRVGAEHIAASLCRRSDPAPAAGGWDDQRGAEKKRGHDRLVAANLTIGAVMLPAQLRMRRAAGRGIVALELAGCERRERALMRAWGREGRRSARSLQWLDFAYLATYAPFLHVASLAAGERLRQRRRDSLASLGQPVAQTQPAAGTLDAVEKIQS